MKAFLLAAALLFSAGAYGLRDGSATLLALDASYAISESWSLNAWFTRDHMEATQLGQRNARDFAGEAVKDARLEDIGTTLGAALRGTLMPKLKGGVELLYSKNVNRYPESIALTGPGDPYPSAPPVFAHPLKDITNTLTRFKVNATYALLKNADVRVDYIHERWQTDDWSWMFADGTSPFTYGTTTDGTQLVQPSTQNADFIGVRFIYKFQ